MFSRTSFHRRSRSGSNQAPVEIELPLDSVDIDIRYLALDGSMTDRRIRPLGLKFLKDGDIAVTALCMLREEPRTFAFSRMTSVSIPDQWEYAQSGCDAAEYFEPDIRRLMLHDAAVNSMRDISTGLPQCDDLDIVKQASTGNNGLSQSARHFVMGAIDHIADLALSSGAPTLIATVTSQVRSESIDLHVDVPPGLHAHNRKGSMHERIALLGKRSPLRQTAQRLMEDLQSLSCLSDPGLSAHITVYHRDGINFALPWLRNIPLSSAPLSPTACCKVLAARISSLSTLRDHAKVWNAHTNLGSFRIEAEEDADALKRLKHLLGEPQMELYSLQKIHSPSPDLRFLKRDAA